MQGCVTEVVLESHRIPSHPSIQSPLLPQARTVPLHPLAQEQNHAAPEQVPTEG